MQRFTEKIVNLMKEEKLYASQGGPIIFSQIENEYQNVEAAFHDKGPPYVRWAAKMAVGLNTGVPWTMCKQSDAPDPVINTCNGLNCGETFQGPNSPNKPSLWTENWTQLYQVFGEELRGRPAEDIAFAVALFVAKSGSFVNYYMYHGGTNFGRSGSSYVTTSYYDDAPLDEYGLISQPKWGHLKDLHAAIKSCSATLLSGNPSNISLGEQQEAYVFQDTSGGCVAFLSNSDRRKETTVYFRNIPYELPARSISILPDCKNVVFNTRKINAQYRVRSVSPQQHLSGRWQAFKEIIPTFENASFTSNTLLEQMGTTKDVSDYLWYTFSYTYTSTDAQVQPVLHVDSRAHVLHAFVNGAFIGSAQGGHGVQSFSLSKGILLKDGKNDISLLSVMVGLPDGGGYMERKFAGLRKVRIDGLSRRSKDFTNYQWGYQVGLLGEKPQIYKLKGSRKVSWESSASGSSSQPLMWYKTNFITPQGNDPLALNLSSMGKGEAWVNGNSIGRYWVSFLTPKGVPSQTLYHVPREFLKSSQNLLVLFEEIGGDPTLISLNTISVSKVCGHVSDSHPPPVVPFSKLGQTVGPSQVQLECPSGKTISSVDFASFGTPSGNCGSYAAGSCHSKDSTALVEKACIGKKSCSIPLSSRSFGADPCPGSRKSLLVDASCA